MATRPTYHDRHWMMKQTNETQGSVITLSSYLLTLVDSSMNMNEG